MIKGEIVFYVGVKMIAKLPFLLYIGPSSLNQRNLDQNMLFCLLLSAGHNSD